VVATVVPVIVYVVVQVIDTDTAEFKWVIELGNVDNTLKLNVSVATMVEPTKLKELTG
jgi:hypothetical protein